MSLTLGSGNTDNFTFEDIEKHKKLYINNNNNIEGRTTTVRIEDVDDVALLADGIVIYSGGANVTLRAAGTDKISTYNGE